MIQFRTKTCNKKSDWSLWERFFLYVTTRKRPRKATTSVSHLWTWWGETDTEVMSWPCSNERDAKGITVEPATQYGSCLHVDVTWQVAKPSELAVIPPSLHWTHTLLPASRGKVGSTFYFPSPLKGWLCILLSPTEYDGNDTPPVQGLVSKRDFLSQKWVTRLRSLHTRRLSCSKEAQASHVRPHGERGPQPGTSYPSSPAEAPDMWVMKLSWTFQPQKMQRE